VRSSATASAAEALEALAGRVARLRPCWQQPAAFFEARSDLAAELRQLARQIAQEARVAPVSPKRRWVLKATTHADLTRSLARRLWASPPAAALAAMGAVGLTSESEGGS
jgi:hypothetical protein